VPDPYYGSERDFELVLDLVEDACDGLVLDLGRELGRAERGGAAKLDCFSRTPVYLTESVGLTSG
jgi:hypothetical protein